MRNAGINPRIHNLGFVEIHGQVQAPATLPPGKSICEGSTTGQDTLGKRKCLLLPGIFPRFPGLAAHRLARVLTQTSVLVFKGFLSVSTVRVWHSVIIFKKKIEVDRQKTLRPSLTLTDVCQCRWQHFNGEGLSADTWRILEEIEMKVLLKSELWYTVLTFV